MGLFRSKTHPIDKWCPRCGEQLVARRFSRWTQDEQGDRAVHAYGMEAVCPRCGVCTVEDPFVPANDNPPQPVRPDENGWLRCPCCGIRFPFHDRSFCDGQRHLRCGQRLRIEDSRPP